MYAASSFIYLVPFARSVMTDICLMFTDPNVESTQHFTKMWFIILATKFTVLYMVLLFTLKALFLCLLF